MTTDSVAQQITPDTPAWRRWRLARGLDQYDTDAGPCSRTCPAASAARPAAPAYPPGPVSPAGAWSTPAWRCWPCWTPGCCTWCTRPSTAFIFSQKHEHTAAQVQALALDAAMIIFSVLALGLARKGLGAPAERAAIVVCAAASAFMNWTAADQASLRSVAVYVAAPILLALTTDRTISVVRRHVLGMKDDASPWARLAAPWPASSCTRSAPWWTSRAPGAGSQAAILAAAPLPEAGPAAMAEDQDSLRPSRGAGHGPGAHPLCCGGRPGRAAGPPDVHHHRPWTALWPGSRASRTAWAAWSGPPGPAPTRPRRRTSGPVPGPCRLRPARFGRSCGQGPGRGGRGPGQHDSEQWVRRLLDIGALIAGVARQPLWQRNDTQVSGAWPHRRRRLRCCQVAGDLASSHEIWPIRRSARLVPRRPTWWS